MTKPNYKEPRTPFPIIASRGQTSIERVEISSIATGYPPIRKNTQFLAVDESEGRLAWERRSIQMAYERWLPTDYSVEQRAQALGIPHDLLEAVLQQYVTSRMKAALKIQVNLRTPSEKKELETYLKTFDGKGDPPNVLPLMPMVLFSLRYVDEWASPFPFIHHYLRNRQRNLFDCCTQHEWSTSTVTDAERFAANLYENKKEREENEAGERVRRAAEKETKENGFGALTPFDGNTLPLKVLVRNPMSPLADPGGDLWAYPMKIETPPRPYRSQHKPTRHGGYTMEGDNLSAPHRYLMDLRIWQSQARPRLSVVVDCSGSMGLKASELKQILDHVPAAIVAGYNGGSEDYAKYGRLRIFAMRGRRVDDETLENMFTWGGNGIDGLALRWLSKQPPPRVWVSDQGVEFGERGLQDCLRVCALAKIAIVPNIASLLKGLAIDPEAIAK